MADEPSPTPIRFPGPLEGNRFSAFEVWKQYEEIAKHFNDLISRLRFQALAGVAGLSASIGLLADRFAGPGQTRANIATLAFGVLAVLWFALFILDFFYYNRLLLGAVLEIVKVEHESRNADSISHLGFSTTVRDTVEAPLGLWEWRKTQRGPLLFYGIVFLCLFGLAVMSCFQSRSSRATTTDRNLSAPGTTNTSDATDATGAPNTATATRTELTPPPNVITTSDVINRWEEFKKRDPLANVATLVESGARLLAPVFERAGEPTSKALELGRMFFEHLVASAGDETGKRTIDAVFNYSAADTPRSWGKTPIQGLRTFSVQTGIVRFDLDKAALPPSGQSTIQRLLAVVPRRNAFWLLVGSTDRSGSEAHNTRLANQRIDVVVDYLAAHDVDRHLILRKPLPELAAPIPGYDGGMDPENRKTDLALLVVR
jgi:outer membrane protein OmpA-like peptidoglycan-associated protein